MEEIERCMNAEKHLQGFDSPRNPKHAQELVKEIAFLDMQVLKIEKSLLSMYQATYDNKALSFVPLDDDLSVASRRRRVGTDEDAANRWSSSSSSACGSQALLYSSIRSRSYLSLSQNASYTSCDHRETDIEPMHSFHSLPLSAQEVDNKASGVGLDHVRQTPNRLSEEMVKCIAAIYCRVAEPPLLYYESPTSPISFSSSLSESPTQFQYDRSPQQRRNSSYNTWHGNSSHLEDSEELSGSYSAMVEIQGIDASRLTGVEQMLKRFRSLVSKLENVDPRKLKHEEKLAFWINVHNVLVMHVFLVHGIPQNNLKRNSLVVEAAYNVGGHTITVDMIQSSILGCQMPRPRQWFQSLLFRKSKFKHGELRKLYAVGCPQPLVKFALTSGSYSDPVVRVYTPKRLMQELEMAKQEYLRTSCKIENGRKIFIPKFVESYAKELGLSSAALFQMIEHSTSYCVLQNCIHQSQQENKLFKNIEWIPHNFNFRYLFAPQLAKMI
ncbi:hypothetical protein ACET3Z_002768 [Daucus carota]